MVSSTGDSKKSRKLALNGHQAANVRFPLLGVKRTSQTWLPTSANDPERTLRCQSLESAAAARQFEARVGGIRTPALCEPDNMKASKIRFLALIG